MSDSYRAKHIVSLGSLCLTSKLLQSMGLKAESYPFDWIFSTPSMVAHCIDDNFASFLNKDFYLPVRQGKGRQCHHTFYNSDQRGSPLFNHRDPSTDEDYDYLVRCVNRFRAVLQSPDRTLFVLMQGHDAPGNTSNFDLVRVALERSATKPALLYLSYKSNGDRRHITTKRVNNCALIEFAAGSRIHSGVRFEDAADDELVCQIISENAGIKDYKTDEAIMPA